MKSKILCTILFLCAMLVSIGCREDDNKLLEDTAWGMQTIIILQDGKPYTEIKGNDFSYAFFLKNKFLIVRIPGGEVDSEFETSEWNLKDSTLSVRRFLVDYPNEVTDSIANYKLDIIDSATMHLWVGENVYYVMTKVDNFKRNVKRGNPNESKVIPF